MTTPAALVHDGPGKGVVGINLHLLEICKNHAHHGGQGCTGAGKQGGTGSRAGVYSSRQTGGNRQKGRGVQEQAKPGNRQQGRGVQEQAARSRADPGATVPQADRNVASASPRLRTVGTSATCTCSMERRSFGRWLAGPLLRCQVAPRASLKHGR